MGQARKQELRWAMVWCLCRFRQGNGLGIGNTEE